jgi:hypothetical protein
MQKEQSMTEVLNQAMMALTALDLNKLEQLEREAAAFAGPGSANSHHNTCDILAKQRLLSMLLQNCRSNLDAVSRLHGRNTGEQWAH